MLDWFLTLSVDHRAALILVVLCLALYLWCFTDVLIASLREIRYVKKIDSNRRPRLLSSTLNRRIK